MMKDIREVAKTRLGPTRMDRWMHTWMDEGHFYSPPQLTSGDM